MTGPGHVFVVHGSLPDLVCDLALIPTDTRLAIRSGWGRYSTRHPDGPTAADVAATRQAFASGARIGPQLRLPDRPPFRYVDVGRRGGGQLEGEHLQAELDWLDHGVEQALAAALQDSAGLNAGRERPLVGLPAFGTAGGGFDRVRGTVAASLLRRCQAAVETGQLDLVIVCLNRADFAFLQHMRVPPGSLELTRREQSCAEALGESARGGGLSLFLGAGVSIAAGLPGFAELVTNMAAALDKPYMPSTAQEAAAAAASLRAEVSEEQFKQAAAAVLKGVGGSLLHTILASMRSAEVMTTNFDQLYEDSAEVTYAPRLPDVLPWQRGRRRPWLLKMHGSVGHPGELVITSDQLAAFNEAEAPLASLVQSQLLTRDVLFVGYSLQDPNVLGLARSVKEFLRATGHEADTVGTMLVLEPLGAQVQPLAEALDVVDLGRGSSTVSAESARRLEIFCDLMLWQCVRDEPAWQLDPRYQAEGEDQQLRSRLREVGVPAGRSWQPLRELLANYGLREDDPSQDEEATPRQRWV
jgi:hypothetical protein